MFMADLLLFAALLMEFAAQSSKGITNDISQSSEELSPLRLAKLQSVSIYVIMNLICKSPSVCYVLDRKSVV